MRSSLKLEEKAEEILETLWVCTQEGKADYVPAGELGVSQPEAALEQLAKAGYIERRDGQVRLTEAGRPEAETVVRRHRLAERLLADVLATGEALQDDRACKFEHLLDEGLDESICTLLGHPKLCPHGKPIPPGQCCTRNQRLVGKVMATLAEMRPGQSGEVAYLYARRSEKLQKLMSIGIIPGAIITVIQSFPTCTFQMGHTQFAVDKDIADAIYLRLREPSPHPTPSPPRRFRWRWGKGNRGGA